MDLKSVFILLASVIKYSADARSTPNDLKNEFIGCEENGSIVDPKKYLGSSSNVPSCINCFCVDHIVDCSRTVTNCALTIAQQKEEAMLQQPTRLIPSTTTTASTSRPSIVYRSSTTTTQRPSTNPTWIPAGPQRLLPTTKEPDDYGYVGDETDENSIEDIEGGTRKLTTSTTTTPRPKKTIESNVIDTRKTLKVQRKSQVQEEPRAQEVLESRAMWLADYERTFFNGFLIFSLALVVFSVVLMVRLIVGFALEIWRNKQEKSSASTNSISYGFDF